MKAIINIFICYFMMKFTVLYFACDTYAPPLCVTIPLTHNNSLITHSPGTPHCMLLCCTTSEHLKYTWKYHPRLKICKLLLLLLLRLTRGYQSWWVLNGLYCANLERIHYPAALHSFTMTTAGSQATNNRESGWRDMVCLDSINHV